MNRYDLIQRVYSSMDRNPNTTSFKNEVIGYLNDGMLALAAADKWLFLEERTTITVYPDYTTGTVTVTNGSRTVSNLNTATWGSHMNGHWFVGPDGKTYTIAWVDPSPGATLYLSEDYEGATAVLQSYTVRFFAYTLPANCIEPGPLTDRVNDRGRVQYIDAATEANYYFDRDTTGDPLYYLNAGAWHTRTMDLEFATSVTKGAGSLTASSTYRYCVTVFYEGCESGPTKIVSGTTTGTFLTIDLVGLQDFRIGGVEVGYRKRIWRDDGTGIFYFLAETTGAATSYADDGSVAVDFERPLQEFGERWKIWFYPRPDGQQALEVWYKRRMRRLQQDQDVPDWPQEFHDVLWRQAAIEVARKFNQPTQALEKTLEERLTMMRRRYMIRHDRQWRMQNGWAGLETVATRRRYNLGTPSIS
ncbi:MAG: hypothetical protein ABIL09_13795 [Gemmatimonadota bacterium]